MTLTHKIDLEQMDKENYAKKIAYHLDNDVREARFIYKEIVERTGSIRIADDCWVAGRKLLEAQS